MRSHRRLEHDHRRRGGVATAVASGSLALVGFKVNAVVDSSVSALLVLAVSGRNQVWAHRCWSSPGGERVALGLAAAAFSVIALYIGVRAVLALARGHHTATSAFGLAEAAASLVVLPVSGDCGKWRLSVVLGSRALRADSLLTVSGIALAAIALVGQLAQRELGGWGADALAGLVMAGFLGWQGVRSARDARQPPPGLASAPRAAGTLGP